MDEYMQMKKDGHIKFYTKDEWLELGKKAGLVYEDGFETSIRFPKKRETALEFLYCPLFYWPFQSKIADTLERFSKTNKIK